MSAPNRLIVAYIRRDDISWWAGCEYADKRYGDIYITETPTLTRWGAKIAARRIAARARRLRVDGLSEHKAYVGEAR